jgi:hypothetical protein
MSFLFSKRQSERIQLAVDFAAWIGAATLISQTVTATRDDQDVTETFISSSDIAESRVTFWTEPAEAGIYLVTVQTTDSEGSVWEQRVQVTVK